MFYDLNTKLLHAFENDVEEGEPREFVYRLKGEQDDIAKEHREEILNYCLAVVLPTEEVGLGDIFMHGKYIERINYINYLINTFVVIITWTKIPWSSADFLFFI